MRPWLNNLRVVGIFFLLVSLGYLWSAQSIPLDFWSEQEAFNARSLPYLIGIACVIISLLMLVLPSPTFDWSQLRELNFVPATMMLALLSAYGFMLDKMGFLFSTFCLLAAGFLLLGERRPLRILLVAAGVTGIFWLIMDLLGIYLNPGDLFLDWS
ncbi:MAG: putative tricarboxylic transport membrane protein [Candidatus Azotimanducaceae bacterium]|jgi:putative tricarboxylic transport membrane protein